MLKEITKEQISQTNLSNSIRILLSKQRNQDLAEKNQQRRLLFLADAHSP